MPRHLANRFCLDLVISGLHCLFSTGNAVNPFLIMGLSDAFPCSIHIRHGLSKPNTAGTASPGGAEKQN